MGEYLVDHIGIFDAGNDLHGTAAVLAGSNVDIEYPFEPLSPCHCGMTFGGRPVYGGGGCFGFSSFAPSRGGNQYPKSAVGSEHAMKASQIDAGLGYQCSEASHEIQWFEDDVGGTVVPRSFERVANLAVCGERQPFLGHGGPGNVAAQAFEFVALIGFRRNPGMEGKSRDISRASVRWLIDGGE